MIAVTLNIKKFVGAGRVAQVVECLPRKHKALSSNQYHQKKKERKKFVRTIWKGKYRSCTLVLPIVLFP
jgi:hypothetical protein